MSANNQGYLKERTLFEKAVRIESDSERSELLESECLEDPELRQRLEVMLEDHFKAEGNSDSEVTSSVNVLNSSISEDSGSTIGPYKLLQKIGEGGFDVVYMADQKEPIKRRVALKIIKLGMDSKQVVGRFGVEREALAMMEHPNIAKVFDAGATESGRPYFVMELVKGIPVTQYCDENHLTTRERLELFVPVCKAIQHAHQKGVIHRDIKPGNIMVTLHDGIPVPKVIDFGIAKATQQELTEQTVFTQYGQFIGTPTYMSPEQAEMSGLDIDTRSDIYSLGVLLYELITGRTPLDFKKLMSGGYDEIRRRIREEEPTKPSTCVSGFIGKDLAMLAKHRKTDPDKLSRHLRGDLDWIVMKALEKDRTRRYDTSNELVADVQRYLNDEPVSAAAPSLVYRFQKLTRRHKIAFRGGVTIIAVILVGSTTAIQQAIRATKAEKLADQRATRATNAEQLAEQRAESERQAKEVARDSQKQAQRQLYYANIQLADRHIEEGNIDRAMQTLAECPPQYRHWEWGRLLYLCHQDIWSTQFASGGLFSEFSPQFSPENDQLATIDADKQLHVWRSLDGEALWDYGGETNRVKTFRFAPDGANLALINGQGAIEVWDTSAWIQRWQMNPVDGERFAQILIRRDRIAATSGSSRVVLFETETGRKLASLEGKSTAKYETFAFGPEGQSVVSSGKNNELSYWRIDPENGIVSLFNQQAPDGSRFVGANEEYAIWGSAGDDLQVTRVASGEILQTLTGFQGEIRSHFFSPDNRLLCMVGYNDMARVWDLASGKEQCTFQGRFSSGVFSKDGKRIVTVGQSRLVRIWDTADGRELWVLRGHGDIVLSASFSSDGKWVASGDNSGDLKVWRSGPGRERLHHPSWLFDVAVSPNGKQIVSASEDGIARVWDLDSGARLHALKGHFHGIFGIDYSLDGHRIVTAGRDETARIWDAATGKELLVLRGNTKEIWDVAYSPDRNRIATVEHRDSPQAGGSIAKIWDASNGHEMRNLKGHAPRSSYLTWHPTGERIATSGSDGIIRIWDTSSGVELVTLEGHAEGLVAVAFSPDGTLLVTGGIDRAIRLWDWESGDEISMMKSKGIVKNLAFSPDGKRLVTTYTGTIDQRGTPSIEIWELDSMRVLLSIKPHSALLEGMVWSKSGDRIISASHDRWAGVAEVWEAFPWRLEDYPGLPNKSLQERTQLYADEYWRQRIVVENLTVIPATSRPYSEIVKIPRNWFPPRDPDSGSAQLDLTEYYNAMLNVSWYPTGDSDMFLGFDLSELPTGLVLLSDVKFDVRGVVQLANNRKPWLDRFPTKLSGIEVGKKLKRLFFLHGANISPPWGIPSQSDRTARYVMNYADGGQAEFPILHGRDLLEITWWPGSGPKTADKAIIAWRGTNSAFDAWATKDSSGKLTDEKELRLFNSIWENPRPDEEIVSIDYVSAKSRVLLPFLIAITVEP